MFWYVSGLKTKTCVIPYYVVGEQQDFNAQLVIEAGETMKSAYLSLTDSFFVGSVQCRIEPSATWLDIGGVFDSTCFLGTLVGPCEVAVEFRIEFAAGHAGGEFVIPVQLFHGEGLPGGPDYTFSGADDDEFPLWGEEEHDAPLWNGAEGDAPFYESGSMCGRKEYFYLPPGETLSKWNVVRAATDGDEAAYQAADCVESGQTSETLTVEKTWLKAIANGTLGEANSMGVIDDDCVNYVHALDGVVVGDGAQSVYWQGGSIGGTVTDRVWRLDRLTRLWDELASGVIAGRKYHTGVHYAGKIYVWGGQNANGTFLNSLFAFDLTTETWAELTAGGTARCLAGAMLVGDKIHFVGGVDSSGNVLRTVDIYDISEDAWSAGTEAPVAFASLDLALSPLARPVWQVCDGILFYGGSTAGRTEVFWQYDGTAWTAPAPLADQESPGRGVLPNVPLQPTYSLPQNCVRLQPYGTDGLAEWVGIPTVDGRLADTWNEDIGTWSTIDISERRALTQGFCTDASWTLTIGQQQWLDVTPGGITTTRPEAGWIQVLCEAVSATTLCFSPQIPVYNITRWVSSAWCYDGVEFYYEFGGNDGTGVTNRLRRLSMITMQWEELTAGCTARTAAGMTYSAGYLYVVGGKDSAGNLLNTMCIYNSWTDTWSAAEAGPFDPMYDVTVLASSWPNDGFWAGEWQLNMCYYDNSVVYLDGVYYQALQTALAVTANKPGVGADWEDYWEVITELPVIYTIGGTTDEGAGGDVWIYDPNTDTWNEGVGVGDDFTDNFNTTTEDFASAVETALAVNADASNEWLCGSGYYPLVVGSGAVVYVIGVLRWGDWESPYFKRTLTPYMMATDEWGASFDLTGDYTSWVNNPEGPIILTHAQAYGNAVYLFGQGTHDTYGECFMAFKVMPTLGTMTLVAYCRDEMIIGTNDRDGCSASHYDAKMWIYGGRGAFANIIDYFDFETESFTEGITAVGVVRREHGATAKLGVLYVFYGEDNDNVVISTVNSIDLATLAYAEITVPEAYAGVEINYRACSDDDGNLYQLKLDPLPVMVEPDTNTWTTNPNTFSCTTMETIGEPAYYAGALYYAICDGVNAQMFQVDFGAGYIPLAVTRTVVRNSDGSFTITWSTGEVYIYVSVLSNPGGATTEWSDVTDVSERTTQTTGSSATETSTVSTGWTTDDGGQTSVDVSYIMTKNSDGTTHIQVQTTYEDTGTG